MESIYFGLKCLNYSHIHNFDITSMDSIIMLICWLEDQKIREWTVQERETLRNYSDNWNDEFQKYLSSMECPYHWNTENSRQILTWLINHAIQLEYEDISEQCQHLEESVEESDQHLSSQINELGSLVGIQRVSGESDADVLDRIYKIIRFFPETVKLQNHSVQIERIENFPLGFDTGDSLVNRIAIILKMLHLSDFRELQSDLNSLIVLGQDFTANPRTNASLGQVGR